MYNSEKFRFGGLRQVALERDNWECVECGMTNEQHILIFGRGITVDHIDGKGRDSKEPNNTLDNLQTLCLRCHGKKDIKRKTPEGRIRSLENLKLSSFRKGKGGEEPNAVSADST